MIKIILTFTLALTAASSLQAQENLQNKHQDDLQAFRNIKKNVMQHEESMLTLKRDTKSSIRDHKVQTHTAIADLRGVELDRRAKQYNRRNSLQKVY